MDKTQDTKTHPISQALASFRERDQRCPVCNDGTRIVKRLHVNHDKETDVITINGEHWVCENHSDNTEHYQLSPSGGRRGAKPRETVGSSVPKQFMTSTPEVPRIGVVKRMPNGQLIPLQRR